MGNLGEFHSLQCYSSISLSKQSTKHHNAPERVLQRKVLEMTSLIRRLDESNQHFAARNQELVRNLIHVLLLDNILFIFILILFPSYCFIPSKFIYGVRFIFLLFELTIHLTKNRYTATHYVRGN